MLQKFGTGDIVGCSKTGIERLLVEASGEFGEAERAEILAEGEEESEGE